MAAGASLLTAAHAEGRYPADFVSLRDIDASIRQDIRCAGRNNFVGRPLPGYDAAACVVRRPVALALKRVQADLAAKDLMLKVYDCYRPARAVAAMAHWVDDAAAAPDTRRFYPNESKSRLMALGYIARHSAHSRGVAIDLTIVARNTPAPPPFDAKAHYGGCTAAAAERAPDDSLDMGTGFDCFDVRSYTNDNSIAPQQRFRRRILSDAMTRQGFKNYFREWWHFSYPAADGRTEFDFSIGPE